MKKILGNKCYYYLKDFKAFVWILLKNLSIIIFMMKKLIIIFLFFISISPSFALNSRVRLWLDKTEVYSDEVVTVYIKLPEKLKNTHIDFTPYMAHFNVISHNNVRNPRYDYTMQIVPKKFGFTMTPPLIIGEQRTERIMVKRYEQKVKTDKKDFSLSEGNAPDLFIKLEQVTPNIYPFSETVIRVKLYDGIGIMDGVVDDPMINGVQVKLVKENDVSYGRYKNRGYIIKSWDYSFLLGRKPEYMVNQVKFKGMINGKIISGEPNFNLKNPFQGMSFGPERKVEILSEPLSLSVAQIESDAFPASRVELNQTYEYDQLQVKIDSQIKRHITMTVFGSSPEAIIDPEVSEIAGFAVFPSEVSKTVQDINGELATVVKRTFVYVPETTGRLVIPEFYIEWYNTMYGRKRGSSLEAKEIFVYNNPEYSGKSKDIVSGLNNTENYQASLTKTDQPSFENSYLKSERVNLSDNTSSELLKNQSKIVIDTTIPNSLKAVSSPQNSAKLEKATGNSISNVEKQEGIITLFGKEVLERSLYKLLSLLALVLLFIGVYISNNKKVKKAKSNFGKRSKISESLNEFFAYALKNDAKGASISLIKFADETIPEESPHNLEKIGLLFGGNSSLMSELEKLNQYLYYSSKNKWDGEKLASLLRKYYKIVEIKVSAKKGKDSKKDDSLPSLYMN